MDEKTFSRNFMKAWSERTGNMYYHKVADVPMTWMGDQKHIKLPRAVDYFACIDGQFWAIEWKIHKSMRAIPVNKVRDKQIETLRDVEAAGGCGIILIALYVDRNPSLYIMTASEWVDAARMAMGAGRLSIPLSEISRYRHEPGRDGNRRVWDYANMFKIELPLTV